jgi:PAS domain S-box-containing protein
MGLILIQGEQVKYSNEAAKKILEYSHEEIISWNLTDIQNLIFEDDLAFVKKDSKMFFTQSEKEYKGSNHLSFRIISKSGKVKWVNLCSNIVLYKDKPADLISFSDITERKIPEELIKIKDDRLRMLSEQALMCVMIVQDGKLLYSNEAFSKMSEYSKEEVQLWEKNKLFELIHPDDREKVKTQAQKKQSGITKNIVPHYFYRVFTKSGKVKWLENYSKSIIYEGKSADFVMTIDITEQKMAEQKLKESEEMFKLMGEQQALMGVIIVQEGKVQYLNNTLAILLGYPRDEIKKWTIQNLFKIIHPSDIQVVLEQARKKQIGNHDIVPHYAFRVITRSGKIKWIENYSKTVTFQEKPALFGSWIDITEFKKSEEDLRKSLNRHRLLSENAKDLIFTLNLDMKITFISETVKYNLGYESEELLNQPVSKIITEMSMIIAHNAFKDELEKEKNNESEDRIRRIELDLIHKDGSIISSEATTTFSRDDDGNAIGIMGVARNISERKKIMKELKTSNLALENYVYKISHELKTPLTSISNFVSRYLSRKKPVLDEQSVHFFDRIQKNIEDMKRLITEVLENYEPPLLTFDNI